MKYKQKQWVIHQGEPCFIDYYSEEYDYYVLIKSINRNYKQIKENAIEDIYPVEDIPTFSEDQTILTLTGQITQIKRVDKCDNYTTYQTSNGVWCTPFEITEINY